MIHSIQIGPLSLPPGLILLGLVLAAALIVGNRLGRKAGLEVENRIHLILLAGAVTARAGFILQQHQAYLASPWSMLDIRDGGWSAWAGTVGAWLCAVFLIRRHPSLKKPLLPALAVSSLVWVSGLALLNLPPRDAPSLPTFSTLSMEGTQVALPAYVGKPTIINLWATWCPPCRREMPAFERVQKEHPEVHIVFLNQGEAPAKIQQFLANNNLTLKNVLLDTQGEVGRSLGHRSLPTTLLFNAEGRLVDTRVGEFSYPTLVQRINALKDDD
ncbi:prolipoprotein diacylglyceryl transferase family protein [Ottowia caeni]|uniref:TlpA family protein disulfide reductase n=1 Tax=Ottowia caeni TaxID=2870339 RepID=UPI003D720A6B